VKHEQAVGVLVGIGEVVRPPAPRPDAQVLLQVVDLELLQVEQRRREPVVLIVGLVDDAEPGIARRDRSSGVTASSGLLSPTL